MSNRFEKLIKLRKEPAAKQLAQANILLKTPLESPASAPPETVLAELAEKSAWLDVLLTMSVLLLLSTMRFTTCHGAPMT